MTLLGPELGSKWSAQLILGFPFCLSKIESNDTSVDEYKIHNENGRVVITPMPDTKENHSIVRNRSISQPIGEPGTSSSISTTSDFSNECELIVN